MYLGSVRFFKHLIYVFVIMISLILIFVLYIAGRQLGGALATKTAGAAITDAAAIVNPDPASAFPDDEPILAGFPPFTADTAKISYQISFPNLYAAPPRHFSPRTKTVYLTFDDGPSARTTEILEILKEQNVKATFFVVTKNSDKDVLKSISEEGHVIGIHSHTHEYGKIYRSVDAFLEDFQKAQDIVYEATSVRPVILRLPGGSINSYNRGIFQELISEILRRGFLYYDWNISAVDTVSNVAPKEIVNSVLSNIKGKNNLFILAHDSNDKKNTVKALSELISSLKELGFDFDKIDNTVEPVVFGYPPL